MSGSSLLACAMNCATSARPTVLHLPTLFPNLTPFFTQYTLSHSHPESRPCVQQMTRCSVALGRIGVHLYVMYGFVNVEINARNPLLSGGLVCLQSPKSAQVFLCLEWKTWIQRRARSSASTPSHPGTLHCFQLIALVAYTH